MFNSVIKDEIKVPGHIDYLGELRNFVTKTGKKYGYSETVVNAFKLSIDEAATNIIKHAYRDWEGDITMRIIVKKNSLTVILIDQGKYFDPSKTKDPDLKRYVDIGKKGGLGIFIMRKLIDEIEYRHTEEGNELRLTKFRDGAFSKKGVEKTAPQKAPGLPFTSSLSLSLKSRYSLVSAAILTIIVIIGYMYFYIAKGNELTNEILTVHKQNSENVARLAIEPGEKTFSIVYLATEFVNSLEELPDYDEIYRVIILNNDRRCQYSTAEELIDTVYELPQTYEIKRQGIFKYDEIYDIVSPINDINGQKVGESHLQIKIKFVEKTVSALRNEYLRLALLILLLGYIGIAILIYIVMNPLRKLSDWVKDLGHGEVKDEIDFDTGDELGEIAKAFSDITDKFRQSQVNLAEQERLQKEMQLAQDIQQTLLPTHVPILEGYEIATFYAAAKEVGGDYYDFVEVDKDSLGIVVADVSGKGVPGSLIMTMIRTALRTEARGVKSASEVLARLNDFVVKDMKKGMFVTIFYVIIDSKKRRLNYASAGHNPMILYRQTSNKTYYLNPKGFPVGISLPDPELFKKSIESDTIQLAEDDILLIYTDGITEAMNSKRQLFGEERLLDTIRNNAKLRVEPFSERLKDEIYSFTQGFEQNDDITLVAIKERSSPEKIELQRAQKAHNLILHNNNIREACEEAGITTYAYYNKYKKIFEEEGLEAYEVDDTISLESKHLSIEEKTKIYDIIKKYPEYGAKRISEELNTEKYGFTDINESKIYDELVRSRLNTRQLREAYVARSGKKKRMKPPGTPMLTLDGRVILSTKQYEEEDQETPEVEVAKKSDDDKVTTSTIITTDSKKEDKKIKDFDDDLLFESLISPIEDLLEKRPKDDSKKDIEVVESNDTLLGVQETEEKPEKEEEIEKEIKEELDEEVDVSFVELLTDNIDDESFTEEPTEQEQEEELDELASEDDVSVSFQHLFGEAQIEYTTDVEPAPDEMTAGMTEENLASDSEDKLDLDEIDDDATEKESQPETTDAIELNDDDHDVFEAIEEDVGLDHDFSFKDIWEEDTTQIEGDSEYSNFVHEEEKKSNSIEDDFDGSVEPETIETENFDNDDAFDDDLLLEDETEFVVEADALVIDEIDVKDYFDYNEPEDSLNITEDIIEKDEKIETEAAAVEVADQISFDDLIEEIDHDISFFDSQEETDEYKMDDDTQVIMPQDDNERLNQMLKEKHLVLGLKYYKECHYDKAIEEIKHVTEMYPEFKEIHSILGNAYFRNDMWEDAMHEYQQVKEIDPGDVDAYENIGVIYANKGEYQKAITEWEKLLEIDKNRIDIRKNVEKAKNILEKTNNNI